MQTVQCAAQIATPHKLVGAIGTCLAFVFAELTIVRVLARVWVTANASDRHKAAELLIGVFHHTLVAAVWGRLWMSPSDAWGNDLVFGYDPSVELVAIYIVGMEIWNVAHEWKYNGGSVQMLAHHGITGLLSWWSTWPFLQGYGAFFIGIGSISSVFLSFYLAFKHFPRLRIYTRAYALAQLGFAAAFLSVRVVCWAAVCYRWWPAMLPLLTPANPPQVPASIVLSFLASNVALSIMQLQWGVRVCKGVRHLLKQRS